jgi:mediator of RNA polymerase II transcription subunit 13
MNETNCLYFIVIVYLHASPLQASARRVGLKRLLDWILSVMALSLVPWRLVIGRLGRIGHGELRGWSALLSRKSLKKAVKQLKVTPGAV